MAATGCRRGRSGAAVALRTVKLTPIEEIGTNGILARVEGSDVARAVNLCGASSSRPAPGAERTVLVGSEYLGAVRVTCRFVRLKRNRSYLEFGLAIRAEPR